MPKVWPNWCSPECRAQSPTRCSTPRADGSPTFRSRSTRCWARSNNNHRTAREEIFGPVSSIIPFTTEEEAIAIANDSEYGLAAAIWAADPDHARAVAKRVRAGRIRINGSPINPRTPHGGFKLSGIGREFGRFGVEDFTEYQSIG
ncbi:aldehyde dehydrogenase family protein [Gordonia sp. Z-3]|uniref:aldehyde dehydrogenase family protein n=1 Tax=Gordonia sp. Z-3 TaxID=3115408 RepID=UPI003FA54A2B